MLVKGEAIVIRTMAYGETHAIVTLFTKDHGKLTMIARGAKKPKSRLAASTQLITYGMYLFYRSTGMSTLQQGEVIQSFREIRADLFRTSHAFYMLELLDKVTEEKDPSPTLFHTVLTLLQYSNEGLDPEVLTRIFEMKMTMVAGFAPQLRGCVHCGTQTGPFLFSIKEAGFLCGNCRDIDANHLRLKPTTARLLQLFMTIDVDQIGNISVKKETKQELDQVISAYYDEYSGISLKSKRFLDQWDKWQ